MDDILAVEYLRDALLSLRKQKALGDQAIAQVTEPELACALDAESNSIAIIVKHLRGNMRSRWTDFLVSDGEKPDRDRDKEFVLDAAMSRDQLLEWWEEGWRYVFTALESLDPADLGRQILIGGEPLTVLQAINRQLVHYSYHVGQIVMLAKHFRSADWHSLSTPKRRS